MLSDITTKDWGIHTSRHKTTVTTNNNFWQVKYLQCVYQKGFDRELTTECAEMQCCILTSHVHCIVSKCYTMRLLLPSQLQKCTCSNWSAVRNRKYLSNARSTDPTLHMWHQSSLTCIMKPYNVQYKNGVLLAHFCNYA